MPGCQRGVAMRDTALLTQMAPGLIRAPASSAAVAPVLGRQHDDTDYVLIVLDSRSTRSEHFHAPYVRRPPNDIPFSRSYIRLSGKAHLAFSRELEYTQGSIEIHD
ncbi:uncharacterized [Tachysurus ichikawai]